MATIAELELRVDSTQTDRGTQSLKDFTAASQAAAKALRDQKKAQDDLNNANPPGGGGGSGGGGSGGGNPKPINDITTAIDNQTRKLKALEEQRKRLNASDLKNTNPQEFARLNAILDTRVELIRRQGNALDELARKEEQQQKRATALAQAAAREQEALARAVASREMLAERAAIREQRQLESTLAGLSSQIKAQQEYNRTLEQLNRARATQGMMGGGGMSSAEYDSYVRLAEIKLRDAMATRDNSAEQERLRSKVDSVTATLGKAERATIQYSRDLNILNRALQENVLTADQYNQKLQQITDKRDKAIARANDNSAAEQKLARELRATLAAYDPMIRAQDAYNASVRVLANALQNGKITVQQFNKALTDQVTALDRVKAAQPNSEQSQARRYQEAIDRLLPYNVQLRNLAEAEKALQQAQQQGRVITQQQIADHQKATEAIAAERKEIERRMDASRRSGNSAKQDAAALRGLPAQFTDIVVSLQGGQAPLTVLLQQGGQLKDMFAGVGNAFRAMGGYLLTLLTPINVVAASLATLGVSAALGAQEAIEFNRAMVQTQGISGVSSGQFFEMREQLDGMVGTAGKAAQALTQMAASGKISGDLFVQVGEAAITMERATGTALSEIINDFAALGKDPVDAAVRLDEKYRFLTSAVLAQADALVKQGKEQEAINLLQGEMAKTSTETAQKMIEQAGYIEHAWISVKDVIKETWDALKGIGRTGAAGTAAELARKEAELAALNTSSQDSGAKNRLRALGIDVSDNRKSQLEREITQLKQRQQMEALLAQQERDAETTRKKSVSSLNDLRTAYTSNLGTLDRVKAAQELANQVEIKANNIRKEAAANKRELTAEEQLYIKTAEDAAAKRIQDAKDAEARKDKTPTVPVNTNDVVEAKSNISAVVSEYDNYFKKISTLRDSNVISESAAYYAQKAILEAQAKSVTSAYDQQIEAIKKLQGNKKNSASANISLDNQLSKAEAARLKAMEDNQAKQEQLDIKFTASIEKRNASIKSYNDALREQVRALEASGARAVSGVGRGDRQAGVAQALDDNDRNYARERRRLAEREKEMDPIEYAENLKNLERAHTDMSDQILKNDKAIMDANADWTNGFTKAVENAQDAGLDFASSVNSALSGAFQSAGNALYEFVTTGKLSFSDFASSVIKDMARIASQQAANGLLSALLGVGMAAAGNYGGLTTTGVTGAGSFGQLGGSYTGTGIFGATQAQGGAWSGGTQMFANGGAFTNQIVSTPTAFGMANGAKGIMGEAGDEAIVPLARTRNGDLGVRMAGGAGGGGSVVNVTVIVNNDGSTTSTSDSGSAWQGLGDKIGPIVRKEVYSVLNTEMRPGGTIEPQKGR